MLAMRIISTVILGLMLFLFSGMFILSSEEDDELLYKVVTSIFILAVIFVIVTLWVI